MAAGASQEPTLSASTATARPSAVQRKPQGPPSPGPNSLQGPPIEGQAGAARSEKPRAERGVAMSATQRTSAIRSDLAAAGLMPVGHTVPGPGGDALPANATPRRVGDSAHADYLNGGGWRVVSIKGGDEEGGVTSHRGVLHPDEYVDADTLRDLVERELGFTYEQIRSVYRQGRLSADQRELRAQIDARLLALFEAGGSMADLGRALGFKVETDSHCEPIDNALARARKEQQ